MFKRKKAKAHKETQPHYKKIIYGTLSCDVPQGFTFDENAHLVAFKVPENPTNGEIVENLFSEEDVELFRLFMTHKWWNEPYKKGEKE